MLTIKNKFLYISFGLIYFWFGVLKFFPTISPAENLVRATVDLVGLGFVPNTLGLKLLAAFECMLGLMFFTGFYPRYTLGLALVHLILTFIPMFLLVDISFHHFPYGFSLVGQYIFKNLILIAALFAMYADLPRTEPI